MKKILTIALMCLVSYFSYGHDIFGQTKEYILSQRRIYKIEINTPTMLVLEKGGVREMFLFGRENGQLCEVWGFEYSTEQAGEILSSIKKMYEYEESSELSALFTPCGDGLAFVKADYYKREGATATVFKSDMCGESDRGLYYAVIELK